MQFLKNKKILSLSFLILFALGCTKVNVSDSEWCGDLGDLGASCFHTHNNQSRDISKYDWDTERFGMLCTRAETFTEWKSVIEKLCESSNNCTIEDKKFIERLFSKIQRFKVIDK